MSGAAVPSRRPAGRPASAGPGGAETDRLTLADWARYPKEEVFAVLGALALAEGTLRQSGHRSEAAQLSAAFDLVEAGLVG